MNPQTFAQLQANAEASYQATPRQQFSAQMNQQKQHGNLLTHLLPTIGSIVGGVGGSFLAPGVGTAVGGAGGGALGTLLENKIEGNSATKDMLLNTGMGALGGVGDFAKAGYGATQALRAGEGLASAGSILRYGAKGAAAIGAEGTAGLMPRAVVAADANNGNGLLGKMAQGANNVGKSAMVSQAGTLGKNTAETAARDINGIRNLGYNSFNAAAEHAPAITGPNGALTVARGQIVHSPQASQVNASGFMQMVKDHLANNISLTDSEKKNILTAAENISNKNKLAGEALPGVTSAANIQSALQDIGKIRTTTPAAKTAVNSIYGDVRSTLGEATANVPVDNAMKSQVTTQLKLAGINNPNVMKAVNQAKSWGDLAQIESKFVTASKVAQESQTNALRGGIPGLAASGKPTFTGLLNQASGKAVEKGVSAGGNLIGKMVKPPTAITNPAQLLTQSTSRMVKAQALPAIGHILQPGDQPAAAPNPSDMLASQSPGGASPDQLLGQLQQPPAQGGPSLDSLRQAIAQDLQTTGGKNVNNLMQLGQLYGLVDNNGSPTNGQKALTSAQQTNLDGLNQAAATLGTYYQQLQQAGGGQGVAVGPMQSLLGKVGLGGDQAKQARAVDQTRIDVATTLAKAMTGNSRPSQSQVKQWIDSVPNLSDPQPVAQQKMQNIMALIQSRTKVYQGSGASNDLLTQLNGAQ